MAQLHQTLFILPKASTSIIDRANWFDTDRIKMTYSHNDAVLKVDNQI